VTSVAEVTEHAERDFDLSGGRLCLDFANTVGASRESPKEYLSGYADLVSWSRQAGAVAEDEARRLLREARRRPEAAAATLAHARELREAIYRIFAAGAGGLPPRAGDLATLNASLVRALSHLRVDPAPGGFSWRWEAGAANLDRPLWAVARSAAELLVSEDRAQVRKCAGTGCDWLFLDLSRNHSRRWCDMKSCGNRAKARRYYEKRRRGSSATPPRS
jgi:predicted RNA-binding Zn ribbon-like protein